MQGVTARRCFVPNRVTVISFDPQMHSTIHTVLYPSNGTYFVLNSGEDSD
jgi:hypothetical protein